MPLRTHQTLALLLIFFSFFMSALVSRTVFDRLPHLEDELAYVYQARIFARGDLVIDSPEPRRAYWQPFVVDYADTGNRFGKYSPGWPLQLAVGEIMGQMWVINAFFAALSVALVYRLGCEIFNPDVGVVAAALVAFSPMALLLNATLMSHTSGLFLFNLFIYAYWRIEQGQHKLHWGILAGIALGLLVISRPLTSVAVTMPFILWSGVRVLRTALDDYRQENATFQKTLNLLNPYVALAIITIAIALAIPLFTYAATDDPSTNLYTLVWEYDRVGFGSCCGRSSSNGGSGHTILKGIFHARFDLSLTAADLFGWEFGEITPEIQEHLRTSSSFWPLYGLSFFLIPFGLLFGFREWWLRAWIIVGMLWLIVPLQQNMEFLQNPGGNEQTTWLWLGVMAVWLLIPLLVYFIKPSVVSVRSRWTWLFLSVFVALVGIHLAYWIGSQRYSTRYYFEALSAFAMVTAVAIAWLIRNTDRRVGYVLFTSVLIWSLYTYSTPRIQALHEFNRVSQTMLDEVQERRDGDAPVLVVVTGVSNDVRWRSFGSLMAVTSPYLDSDIVAAWDYAPNSDVRERILQRFPDRQILELHANGNDSWFVDEDCIPGPGIAGLQTCVEGPPIGDD